MKLEPNYTHCQFCKKNNTSACREEFIEKEVECFGIMVVCKNFEQVNTETKNNREF